MHRIAVALIFLGIALAGLVFITSDPYTGQVIGELFQEGGGGYSGWVIGAGMLIVAVAIGVGIVYKKQAKNQKRSVT
ncbi:MAG: hypothetical protein ABIE22_00825 [archaeon]